MNMYEVQIPTWGWRREKIDDGKNWRDNLANPTITVEQDVGVGTRLWVTLEETRYGVEVLSAEIAKWEEEPESDNGGYWGPSRPVSPNRIVLKGATNA